MTRTMTSDEAQNWIRPFGPAGTADDSVPRLVCLPHAGGSASFYRPLAEALGERVPTLGVQYPGRQDRYREPVISDLRELAGEVFTALRTLKPGPVALFGHSMGAVVGYEVALLMRRAGLPGPVRLFASGRRAPSRYRFENVWRRDDAGIGAELRRLAGTHAELLADPEVVELVLPAVRGDYRAIETYRHDPAERLGCPLSVLTGDADPMVSADEAEDWRGHTEGPFSVRTFTGAHFYLLDHIASIAGAVEADLAADRVAGAV